MPRAADKRIMGLLDYPVAMIILCTSALGIGAWALHDAPTCSQIAAQHAPASRSSAAVIVMDCDGRPHALSEATAARVDGGNEWITAAHAIEGPQGAEAWIVDYTGKARRIESWRQHPHLDIVLFQAPRMQGRSYPIKPAVRHERATAYAADGRRRELAVNQTVQADSTQLPSTLIIAGRDVSPPPPPHQHVLELDGEIQPGFSGSPVVDPSGNLIAMAYAMSPGHSYAITAHEISEFMSI